MVKAKVRILADVSIDTRDKLEEVVEKMNITKKEFFEKVIDEYYEEINKA